MHSCDKMLNEAYNNFVSYYGKGDFATGKYQFKTGSQPVFSGTEAWSWEKVLPIVGKKWKSDAIWKVDWMQTYKWQNSKQAINAAHESCPQSSNMWKFVICNMCNDDWNIDHRGW